MHQPLLFGFDLAPAIDYILPIDDFSSDETLFKVSVDFTGGRRGFGAGRNSLGMSLFRTGSEESNQI